MSKRRYVRAALGLHPQLISTRSNEINIWKEYFSETRYIGEIGLDAGKQFYKSFDLQKEIFRTILDTCANKGNKILSIHSVRSSSIVLEMIETSSVFKKNRIVLHWFSGSDSNLKKAIELGCFFSINSEMIKSTHSSILEKIPIDRILTETDGPFTRINEITSRPIFVIETLNKMSELLGHDPNYLSEIIFNNMLQVES